ncbi:MAG: septal ring lytic transglycosylase RlpA family protein [Polyangiales bacterium]
MRVVALLACVSALVVVGCGHSMASMVGPAPYAAEDAPRKPPVTRRGRNNPLLKEYGRLPAKEVLLGKASFYHDSLAGNLTANGEYYKLGKITAAHLTLPFCSVVRVIRRDTGHTVLVRINDRGPYGNRGRILDLSRAAAEAIGMIGIGVAPIRAEVVKVGDGCTYHHLRR